jgi:FkbM family methyltransferase
MRFKDLVKTGCPLQIMDIGAACIAETPVYRSLLDEGIGHLNAFEGDSRQIAKIKETYGAQASVFTNFLADGLVHTLYLAHAESGMTSLYKPNPAALKFFNQFEQFGKVLSTEQIQTTRLDDIADVPAIDFLKMDIQGSELAVLMHGQKKLAKCVAIQLEVSFICLYENQPSFGEVDIWMRANGYVPHCFLDVKRWSIAPTIRNNNFRVPFNQLLESDIVYIKDPLQLHRLSNEELINLALIAHYCLASFDLCVFVILELIARKHLDAATHAQYLDMLAGNVAPDPIVERPVDQPDTGSATVADEAPPLWTRFQACPLCNSADTVVLRIDSCENYPIWQVGLPTKIEWMHCQQCQHIYSHDYFTREGLALLFSKAHPMQVTGTNLDQERARWAPTVERVQGHLEQAAWLGDSMVWLDIGCGSGGLVITAAEYGFSAIGLDSRAQAVERIEALGYSAVLGDLMELEVTDPVRVISLADVLEHAPFPRQALKHVHSALMPGGLLVVSCPNLDSGSWRKANADGVNPYWSELEHHHNFSRASLMRLLAEEGFIPLDYSISTRYKSCMEVISRRA